MLDEQDHKRLIEEAVEGLDFSRAGGQCPSLSACTRAPLRGGAGERTASSKVQQELGEFVQAVRDVPELRAACAIPSSIRAPRSRRSGRSSRTRTSSSATSSSCLTERGRATELEETQRSSNACGRRDRAPHAELATAVDLSDDEAAEIVRQIEQSSGRSVDATRRVDPDLLGGVVLQVGLRLDASLRGCLERLRRELAPT